VLEANEKDPLVIGSTSVNKDIQFGRRVSMANLMVQQSKFEDLLERDVIKNTEWFKSFGDIQDDRIKRAMRNLEDNFSASPQRDSDFIKVSMTTGDKKESALIVNEMTDLFLNSRGAEERAQVGNQLLNMRNRLQKVEGDVAASERTMDDIRNRYNIMDVEERDFRSTIETKLDSLELDNQNISLDIEQIRGNIITLKRQAEGPIQEQVENEIEKDSTMIFLTQQVASLEAQLAGVLTRFGENHRVVRQTRELLNETKSRRQIRKKEISELTRQSNLQNAQDQLVILQSRVEEAERLRQEAESRKKDLDMARIQYTKAVSIRDERRIVRDDIKQQIEKMSIMQLSPEAPKLKKMGNALPPREVSFPKWFVFFPAGTMFGFLMGVGLAFLIELANDLVRTPRDVYRYLHIPLLGVISDAHEDRMLRKVKLEQVVREAPYSIMSESYRQFRTNLKLSELSEGARVILISSGFAGDGKTSVAANLAATFAAERKNVLLIEANFWKPVLENIFKFEPEEASVSSEGLSTLLAGQASCEDVIRHTDILGLDVVTAGILPNNPAELIGSDQMAKFLKQQRAVYDYVIIDGPPVLLVSDTKMLARHADGTVLVFNAETTRRGAAMRCVRELKSVNAEVFGAVVFGVHAMKGGYFHEQAKNYQKYHGDTTAKAS
jgi:capsular exopolysaccharide synthesis family protein